MNDEVKQNSEPSVSAADRVAEIDEALAQAREERKNGGDGISREEYKKLMREREALSDEVAAAKYAQSTITDLEKQLDDVQTKLADANDKLKADGEKMPYEEWRALADLEKELSSVVAVNKDKETVKRIRALRNDPQAYAAEISKLGSLHNYSIANVFGFLIERPDVVRVANRVKWEERGMSPKAGEKAMWVNTPIFKTRKRKGPDGKWIPKRDAAGKQMVDENGKKMWEEVKTRIGFKYIRGAWDINQMEVTDRDKYTKASVEKETELVEVYQHYLGVMQDQGVKVVVANTPECPRKYNVQFLNGGVGGFYDPKEKVIVLAPEHDINNRLGTLFHEIGHHVLGHDITERNDKAYAINELEAETLAQYLAGRYGVDREFSDAYRASWGKNLEDTEMMAALNKARKHAHKLHSAHDELTVRRGLELSVPLETAVSETEIPSVSNEEDSAISI